MKGTRLAALALCIGLTAAEWAVAEVELYKPEHRLPSELRALAEGVMGSGTVSTDPGTGTLVLHGPRDEVRRALEVLRKLDVPLRTYQIESQTTPAEDLAARGFDVSGWVRMGALAMGRGVSPEGGLHLSAGHSHQQSRRRFHATVAVRDGSEAEVWTGLSVPAAVRLHEDGEGRVFVTPRLRPARSGFRVSPRGMGDGSVELTIQAVTAQDSLEHPVIETGARTRVRVEPGEWIALATISRSSSHDGRGTLAWQDDLMRREEVLLVRVRIPDSAGH